ncbi:hypothetical protein [Pyrodictium abyssi]|uniref:Gram-positive cocci surface proteins LPxTG domain-containing protein n=1 Tax=Pyrodictium abyssi TaxID=54256 RepID=A0ABN6ZUP0_9CREN|nr:hypothetical protein PABY_23170 [Pyrodictium abyssi]
MSYAFHKKNQEDTETTTWHKPRALIPTDGDRTVLYAAAGAAALALILLAIAARGGRKP